MEPRQRIDVTQTQRLQLNLRLQSSIQILRADAAGLTRYLEETAAENPALQLAPPTLSPQDWLPRWAGLVGSAGGMPADALADVAPSLMAHVMAGIERLFPRGPQRRIALALAEVLEPSGWLGQSPEEVAARIGSPLPEVEAVLSGLQGIEPAGLFARDLRDCLRLQAEDQGLNDGLMRLVIRHLDLLAGGETARIARIAGTTEAAVLHRFRTIRSFNPKPGSQFAMGAAPVREPDLILRHDGQGWVMALNRSALPSIRVEDGRGTGRAAARAVQKLVEARNSTLLSIGGEILCRQSVALDRGLAFLEPMTMGDIATALGLHESTVSRVVAGTSMDSPRGTWWLRALFSRRMGDGAGHSGAALKARLAALVGTEDAAAPLSDQALAEALSQDGARIARRTVAKYREALDIPPAHRRRQARRLSRDRKGRVLD
jgi:RNA polymerase sigma-54 factor